MNVKLNSIFVLILIAFLFTVPLDIAFGQQAVRRGGGEEEEEIASEDIVEILTSIIPQPPGSSIRVLPGQNKLVVRNTPSNLEKMEAFLETLANPPQVSIESKFVIVGEETFRDLGLEWNSISLGWANPFGRDQRYSGLTTNWPYETGAQQAWSYDTVTTSATSGVNVAGIAPPHVATTNAGLQIAYRSRNYPQIQATLHMLATRSDTKFLSAPAVTTLNNEPSVIRFVKTYNFFEDVDIETEVDEDTGVTTTTYDWEFTTRDIGIVLYVNPVVNKPTKSVRLFLQPVVSDIEDYDYFTLYVVEGEPLQAALPRFTSKDVTTNVDVYDGTTIVLGGLMSEEGTEVLSKVPFFGDIPVLGKAFFQRKATATERQHLLIFITVNVLDSQGNPFFEQS